MNNNKYKLESIKKEQNGKIKFREIFWKDWAIYDLSMSIPLRYRIINAFNSSDDGIFDYIDQFGKNRFVDIIWKLQFEFWMLLHLIIGR